jgi:hypothetical protein
MQLRKALDSLPVALRVIISGTPIQVAAAPGRRLRSMPPRWKAAAPVLGHAPCAALHASYTPLSKNPIRLPPFPIQNNLMELWSLLNFCAPDVLGGAADFRHVQRRLDAC